ncbi:hypothetical protein H7J07_16780 [Mycobacterium koreense]|uniref:Uncharacterized protein n=1 Tax=Mycolicibacillus koreensis TaxID=1069220 RepID=A0A7I7SEX6_9MYCO|nr:hypothetical protein [Mycolicibacillus koreensis]MCV7249856.1 hypothetical protein [Mycolicibacillus koreensis]OSC34919.1 hypothetical protein B8W67_05210 [Mycolicibacillus koreensis]BBY54789.1 hypothetical protein MKOR_20400 [Mycolicibacillus koreensis]
MLTQFLDRQLSIRQLVYLGVVAAVAVGLPYLAIGLIWAVTHSAHLQSLDGLDKVFSALGEVVAWPVLLIADVTLV